MLKTLLFLETIMQTAKYHLFYYDITPASIVVCLEKLKFTYALYGLKTRYRTRTEAVVFHGHSGHVMAHAKTLGMSGHSYIHY